MTARLLSQMLQSPIPWARGLIVGTQRRANQRRANRLRASRGLVLVAYLVMNLGLPTGLGPKVAVAAADKSCHCSAESRAAGRCCCSVKPGQKPKGCCVNQPAQPKPAAVAKSCCAKKTVSQPVKAPVASTEPQPEATLAWTGGCPCSPGGELSMLLCAHPRILASEGQIEFCAESRDTMLLLSQSPCGDRARPCVPPPELSLV